MKTWFKPSKAALQEEQGGIEIRCLRWAVAVLTAPQIACCSFWPLLLSGVSSLSLWYLVLELCSQALMGAGWKAGRWVTAGDSEENQVWNR